VPLRVSRLNFNAAGQCTAAGGGGWLGFYQEYMSPSQTTVLHAGKYISHGRSFRRTPSTRTSARLHVPIPGRLGAARPCRLVGCQSQCCVGPGCAIVLGALLTIGLGHDVVYGLLDCRRVSIRHTSPLRAPARTAVDGIGLLVGDLDAELLLDGHDDLDRVEAVEAEVVVEVRLDVEL
jgi:hypothetical protein